MNQIIYGFDCNRCGHSSSHATKGEARLARRKHKPLWSPGGSRPRCSAVNRARARNLLIEG